MAKYLVETYYTCTFKVNHYLEDINETELKNLEKRDDGKFEVLDVKLDNRKTKSLDPNNNKVVENKSIEIVSEKNNTSSVNKESLVTDINKNYDNTGKSFNEENGGTAEGLAVSRFNDPFLKSFSVVSDKILIFGALRISFLMKTSPLKVHTNSLP